MKQLQFSHGSIWVFLSLLTAPLMGHADQDMGWQGYNSGPSTPNIQSCDDQPGVKLGNRWNWHYPRETPKIKNGTKELKCTSGKKGILYTRDDIEGKYFVTNAKYLKVTPVMDEACTAIKRYCNPKIIELPPVTHKDYKGTLSYQFPHGVYTRADLEMLASGQVQNKTLLAVFEHSGWIKDGVVVSMNVLPSKKAKIKSLAGLLNDDREIMSVMNIDHGGSSQTVIATWDIATEQLVRMVALASTIFTSGVVTPDLRRIFAIDTSERSKAKFTMIDTQTGKLIKVIHEGSTEPFPVISPDGQYIAAMTVDGPHKDRLSNDYWRVWRVSDSQEMAHFSSMTACFDHRHLVGDVEFTFSPDSSKFYIGWQCGKSTTEDGNFSNGKSYGWLGSTETWQAGRVEEFDDVIGDGEFSADGTQLVTYSKNYNLRSRVQSKFTHCKGDQRELGKAIPDTPMHLYITDDTYEFRTALNNQCRIVASGPIGFNSGVNESTLMTGDRKRMVILKEKDDIGSIEVFNINFPDANALSKLQDSAQAQAKRDKEAADEKAKLTKVTDEAQKLYDAGFVAQALDMLDEYAERPNTPPSAVITNTALTWAKKLPLERVGKTLLNMYKKQMSQPVKTGDGFSGDDDISLPEGFSVKLVFPETSAERAGLRKGDVVLAANGVKVNSDAEFKEILRNHKPDDVIVLTVLHNATRQKLSITLDEALPNSGAVWAVFHLLEYGMVAAAAGHPDLTLDAANEAQRVSDKYKSSLHKEKIKSFITALKALSIAGKGDTKKAYSYAVKEGGFIIGGFDLLRTFYIGQNPNSQFWAPLYSDRKKLAYLLKTEASKLPETPTYNFGKQPYPNLKGQMTKKPSKKKSESKKSKVTILDD
ncbi:PDZ domain-containing protein [Sedimenticola selenatireducens]|uniref:PDZ domain-containing protein n=1 Tax=Sedimenticola selenatireducens TaxID=191960 RepID=A0A557S800_9GAMM|nr:PDZ domain-containing protein [Sedimenticola selenatireducens]TVO73517.1 PDZ domain-containing protein [Sedimenticola selenatireducens]TVT63458.1 MAG: PDZ domain-containing protein [Sedimenticola selenatireducens]